MTGGIRHLVFLILVLALAGGTYYLAQSGVIFSGNYNRAQQIRQETAELKREIILPLEQLNSVEIDTNIFTDKVFTSLKDISVELGDPVLQRDDPFAPTTEAPVTAI